MLIRRQFMKVSVGTVAYEYIGAQALAITLLQLSKVIWLGQPK